MPSDTKGRLLRHVCKAALVVGLDLKGYGTEATLTFGFRNMQTWPVTVSFNLPRTAQVTKPTTKVKAQ